jgi:hypothetical protein
MYRYNIIRRNGIYDIIVNEGLSNIIYKIWKDNNKIGCISQLLGLGVRGIGFEYYMIY